MDRVEPYLSLVVTARNDDHGGDLLQRMQAFTDGWLEQSNRFRLESELIIVEWNPVADRPPLADALRWPAGNQFCTVRVITVPAEVHGRYRYADVLALYQMIAKNVGIRRAQGKFVLATNIDILFSSELMERLARRDLDPDRMYRIDRHDAMSAIPPDTGIVERLEWCRNHLLRTNARNGTFPVSGEGAPIPAVSDIVKRESGFTMEFDWYSPESWGGQAYRWVGERATLTLQPPPGVDRTRVTLGVEPGPGSNYGPCILTVASSQGSILCEHRVRSRQSVEVPLPRELGERDFVQLFVTGAGLPAESDPRLANLLVRSIAWGGVPPSAVIQQAPRITWWLGHLYRRWRGIETKVQPLEHRVEKDLQAGVEYGTGWGPWEKLGGDLARFIEGEGHITLSPSDGWREMELDIEAGPAALGRPVRVMIVDSAGSELATALLHGRKRLIWRPGHSTEQVRAITVRAACEGTSQPRLLLLHQCTWRPGKPGEPAGGILAQEDLPGRFYHLHTNACGDFTLLSREAWMDLRGYAEFDAYSMNIDSTLCIAAHHAGYREEMFEEPLRIYHIEHATGSGWTPEGEAELYRRIAKKRIPWLEYPFVVSWERDMNRWGRPILFNLGDWGLAGEELSERVIR
jgi:hypothetical protein